MNNLQTIISLLPSLSPEEVNQLHHRLSALRSVTTPIHNDEEILQCICDQLSSMGVEHMLVPLLKKSSGLASFRSKIPGVLQFLDQSCLNRIERRAVLMVGISLLYDDIVKMGYAVSSRSIMRHIHRLPAVLNNHFPGYANNGLLGKLLTSR